MYTINDLAEGRVAVINDGTQEEIKTVLKKAFPKDPYNERISSKFQWAQHFDGMWNSSLDKPNLPVQSVKDFLKQIEEPWIPKRGDRVLGCFEGSEDIYCERIFVTEIENATYPFVLVQWPDEDKFVNGEKFDILNVKHIKPIPTPQPQTELTMEEIAEKFDIDVNNLKIVK